MTENHHGESERKQWFKTWMVVLMAVAYILIYGLIVFVTVGDRGPADWDYGNIGFTPGESANSTQTYSTDYLKK